MSSPYASLFALENLLAEIAASENLHDLDAAYDLFDKATFDLQKGEQSKRSVDIEALQNLGLMVDKGVSVYNATSFANHLHVQLPTGTKPKSKTFKL